ncbi:MAG: hypothetical protein JSR58_06400 [Verrucomicrobia bacterium]|nr:hypothetical protein [Verrucomicrobiota bacterium]
MSVSEATRTGSTQLEAAVSKVEAEAKLKAANATLTAALDAWFKQKGFGISEEIQKAQIAVNNAERALQASLLAENALKKLSDAFKSTDMESTAGIGNSKHTRPADFSAKGSQATHTENNSQNVKIEPRSTHKTTPSGNKQPSHPYRPYSNKSNVSASNTTYVPYAPRPSHTVSSANTGAKRVSRSAYSPYKKPGSSASSQYVPYSNSLKSAKEKTEKLFQESSKLFDTNDVPPNKESSANSNTKTNQNSVPQRFRPLSIIPMKHTTYV